MIPLKWKFIIVVIFIVFSISVLQNIIFYILDINSLTDSLKNKISVLAEVLAENSTSSIQFRNREDAITLLGSLEKEPSIREAYLFNGDGQVLAEFIAPGAKLSIPLLNINEKKIILTENRVLIQHPITLDQEVIGALYLKASLDELTERKLFRFVFGFFSLLATIILAFTIALWCQKFFIKPVLSLSRLSQEIGEKKQYSLRAEKTSNDELGVLTDSFNGMLDTIQARDKELAYSNKELEQFAYVISHDLKSPLVTIQGFANRFIKQLEAGEREKSEDSARRVQNAAKRMGQLIDDVLALSRIGRKPLKRNPVNLLSELKKIRDDLAGLLLATGTVLSIQENLPTVYADEGEIRQIFQNLIINAIKYGCMEPGKTVEIGSIRENFENRIFVRDEGPGIPKEYHEKIFQLFQRLNVDKNKEGSGLGLAIVMKIMKGLGGRVWVESSPGEGTAFWLAFPK